MTTAATVREHILATFDHFSPKQRRLAQFFLDHEEVVAFASAGEIGQQTGVSAATVVRFGQTLGYQGYTDLQAAIRGQLPQYRTAVQKLADRMGNGRAADNLPTQLAQVNTQNIQQTMSQVSESELTQATVAILQAEQIHIFAAGLSAATAVLAEHALTLLGFSVRACLNGGAAQALEISRLTKRDVVMVIGVWRYVRDTVLAAQAAREVGATCIALTDSPVSPLARLADYVFVAAMDGVAHSHSLAGMITLIDLFSAAIAFQRPQESLAALQRLDTLYQQNEVLWSE